MKSIILFMCILMAQGVMAQDSVTFKLTIKNVRNQQGSVRASLFQGEENYLKKSTISKDTTAYSQGEVVITFRAVPDGEYAISIYHDANDNGEMDANFMGIPTESYGFSNNAPSRFGPAKYHEAKINISKENNQHSITLN
ncbi:MAG: DUF2141 domain-containing protein [Marinoscillum sp.]